MLWDFTIPTKPIHLNREWNLLYPPSTSQLLIDIEESPQFLSPRLIQLTFSSGNVKIVVFGGPPTRTPETEILFFCLDSPEMKKQVYHIKKKPQIPNNFFYGTPYTMEFFPPVYVVKWDCFWQARFHWHCVKTPWKHYKYLSSSDLLPPNLR